VRGSLHTHRGGVSRIRIASPVAAIRRSIVVQKLPPSAKVMDMRERERERAAEDFIAF
ncbi:unnamed protein product, partial [Musa banksii]